MTKDYTKPSVPRKAMSKSAEAKVRQKEEQKRNRTLDKVKLVLALLLVAAGVFAYYFFATLPNYVRVLFPVLGVAAAIVIVFFFCAFGRDLVTYIREAAQEMRKVVWPDKPTTLRMTLTVVAFVAVLALFMLLADSLISWVLFDLLLKRG
ncbi:MAG: preprotein translocase subunit SecE [Neisseria sp.]|nr:preprotein translocase subunit SecE [Neisseria sp.]